MVVDLGWESLGRLFGIFGVSEWPWSRLVDGTLFCACISRESARKKESATQREIDEQALESSLFIHIREPRPCRPARRQPRHSRHSRNWSPGGSEAAMSA